MEQKKREGAKKQLSKKKRPETQLVKEQRAKKTTSRESESKSGAMRKRESSLIHDLAMMELSSESEDERTVCPKCGLLFRVRICGFVATDVHVTKGLI